MRSAIVGIDIAKQSFDVCLLVEQRQFHKKFENSPKGFTKLLSWLGQHDVEQIHACMEATSSYGYALAEMLHQRGDVISIVNAARIHAFGQSLMQRTKTDKADARVIALFCQQQKPEPWVPPAPEVAELQALVRHLDALMVDRQQQANRLEDTRLPKKVTESIAAILKVLDEQINDLRKSIQRHIDQYPGLRKQQDLLTSIPGIGSLTAAKLLGEIELQKNAPENWLLIRTAWVYGRHGVARPRASCPSARSAATGSPPSGSGCTP